MHPGTVSLRARHNGSVITLDVSGLRNEREKSIALRAVESLPKANGHPQVVDIALSPDGNMLTCQAVVTSKSKETKHIKSTRTLVCKAVRQAVIQHRERARPHQPPNTPPPRRRLNQPRRRRFAVQE